MSLITPLDPSNAPSLFDSIAVFKATPFPADYDPNVRRFYAPEDRCHEVLKTLLSSATESLLVSMYGEDDPELTRIIVEKANDPKIFVQINLDKTQAAGRGEVPLVALLRACPNTRVAVGMSCRHKINHLKMVVINGLYSIGGSMNWSADGEGAQNNELVVHMSRPIAHEATQKLNRDHQIMLAQEGIVANPQPRPTVPS